MLQDIEAGRAIEADALIGSVIELGRIVGVAAPCLEAVYVLVKLTAKTLQDERGRLSDRAAVSALARLILRNKIP